MDDVGTTALTVVANISTLLVISLGLAVIFGMMRIINLAYGEFLMVGAYATVEFVKHDLLNVWLAIFLVAPAIAGVLGAFVEIALIRPLYGRRMLDTMLATFGLALVLSQAAKDLFGSVPVGIETPLGSFKIGRFAQSEYTLVLIGFALLLVAVVYLVFTKTRYGVVARATSQNPEMAAALGVNSRRVNLYTFALGSALAGIAGGMIAPTIGVGPALGQNYIAESFMTVITGGAAVLSGVAAAAGVLGGAQSLVAELLRTFYGEAALLVVAIVLLRLIPQGLSSKWRSQL